MKNQVAESEYGACNLSWSNRVLIIAVAGILLLTLYPFRFAFHTKLAGDVSPFILATGEKHSGAFNAFLNIILFVPFGFGLSEKLREKGQPRLPTLLVTMAAGALFSYAIEVVQNYVPTRDSGWEDVFTNSAGAVSGYFIFELFGKCGLSMPRGLDADWTDSSRYVGRCGYFCFILGLGLRFPFYSRKNPS